MLSAFGIETPKFRCHLHNEHHKVEHVLHILRGGQSVALISDAGMPGISDPGFLAVRAIRLEGIEVCVNSWP